MPMNKIRRNGSYAPLSAHYYKDDAIDEAGLEAELLYVRGLAFCADVLSDGFISDRQLVRFVGVGMTDAVDRAKRLVEVDLWERVDGGYVVRSWLDWNRSRAEITDYQAKDRARKTRSGGREDSEPPEPDPPNGGPEPSDRNPNGIHADSDSASGRSPNGFHPRAGGRARTPLNSTPLHDKDTHSPAAGETTKPRAQRAEPDPDAFDEFWAAYPRRVEKRAAEKAWRSALKRNAQPELIVSAAQAYADRTRDTEPRFIKHPASWLNAGAYDDETPTVPVKAQFVSFEDYRSAAAAQEAARVLGIACILREQPPADRTPRAEWIHRARVEWIDAHEQDIRAALAERKTG